MKLKVHTVTNHKEFSVGLRRKLRKAAMDRKHLASVLAESWLYLSFHG